MSSSNDEPVVPRPASRPFVATPRVAQFLCFVSATLLLVGAAAFTSGVAQALLPVKNLIRLTPHLADILQAKAVHVRLVLATAGVAFAGFGVAGGRFAPLRRLFARRATRSLLLGFVALLPLLIPEYALRIFQVAPAPYVRDSELLFRLRPNSDAEHGLVPVPVHVNNVGFRGPDIAYEKPPGTRRILFLGDSVAEGFMLLYEDTFPLIVESTLRENSRARIEVINAGVPGWATWQETAFMKRDGHRFAPDLVVISFTLGDVFDRDTDLPREMTTPPLLDRTGIVGWVRRGRRASKLTEARRRRDTSARAPELAKPPAKLGDINWSHLVTHPDHPLVQRVWTETLKELSDLFATCREHRSRVVLVVFPNLTQVQPGGEERMRTPQAVLRRFAVESGVPMLDLDPVFEAAARTRGVQVETLFLDWDHLSPVGSRITAEAIAEFLRDNGVSDW